MNATPLTPVELATLLQRALCDCGLNALHDALNAGQPPTDLPSVDLAVIALPRGAPAVAANVLFSRELPRGHIASLGGPDDVGDVQFLRDLRDERARSVAWLPGGNWQHLQFEPLHGSGDVRFVSPYPASLVKLMVAVGVGLLVDGGACRWADGLHHRGDDASIAGWCEWMIVTSDNDATDAMVGLLHRHGLLEPEAAGRPNRLHEVFQRHGLHTLRMEATTPAGGWRNVDGAGVGALHMTAWDSARLLWMLLPNRLLGSREARSLLSASSRERLWGWLGDQGLHDVLSSGALAGVPGWERGIPARLPGRWVTPGGSVAVGKYFYPADVRPERERSRARFAHKTGTTENYASDAGLVLGDGPRGRRYVIAMLSSVGSRFSPHPACATDWCLQRLGRLIDDALRDLLES